MGFFAYIIIGGLAGWLASKMMNTNKSMGALANIFVGIIGSIIGGFIMGSLGKSGAYGVNLYSLFVALLGSIILLAVVKALKRR